MTTTPPADTGQTKAVPTPTGARGTGSPGSRGAPRSTQRTAVAQTAQGPAPRTESAQAAASAQSDRSDAAPRRVMGYRRQRFEARKVRRLIRHIDPWSMLKLAVLVSLCMWLITMIASVILWTVAESSGTISSVENFVNSSLQLQDWKLDGEFLFRQFGLITLLLFLGFAASLVVASLVFNLISDIIGGVWISVIEEETARPVSDRSPD